MSAYNDISDEEQKAAERIATRELAAHLKIPEEKLKVSFDPVIRTLWRYRIKGTIFFPNASPFFSIVLNADNGLPGDYQLVSLGINR